MKNLIKQYKKEIKALTFILVVGLGLYWNYSVYSDYKIKKAKQEAMQTIDILDESALRLNGINEVIIKELKKQRDINTQIARFEELKQGSILKVQEAEQEKVLIRNEMLKEANNTNN